MDHTARWITRWKPAVGLASWRPVAGEVGKFGVDVLDEAAPQRVDLDVAGPHDRGRVLVVDQGQEEMFERRVFVAAFAGQGERPVEGLF